MREAIESNEIPSDAALLSMVEADGILINSLQLMLPERVFPAFVRQAALRQNGYAVQYLANPTHWEMVEAVKQTGMALQYLHKQLAYDPDRQEVFLSAVQQNPLAIRYATGASEEVKLVAVSANGLVVACSHLPSAELQVAAVRQNRHALAVIDRPCQAAIAAATRRTGRSDRASATELRRQSVSLEIEFPV